LNFPFVLSSATHLAWCVSKDARQHFFRAKAKIVSQSPSINAVFFSRGSIL